MKPREFWIWKEYDKKTLAFTAQAQEPVHKDKCFHVREVSAEYDAAVEAMREAFQLAPVYVTPDGVWWNFRPDPKSNMGSCMIKVEGEAAQIVRNWHKQISKVLEALEAFDAAMKSNKRA